MKITYLCFGPLMGSFILLWRSSILLWQRYSFFPFVEQVCLSLCGGGLFILLQWWSLCPFVVNNVGGFGCIPGCDRNIAHFIFDMFWVILFGCYFVKIYMLYIWFSIVKQKELLVSNKILYEGVTAFNVFVLHSYLKRKI